MNKSPYNFWQQISNNGIDSTFSLKEVKIVILTNQICITAAILALPHIFAYYSQGQIFPSIIQISTVALFLIPILLNRYKLFFLSRFLFLSVAIINVFLTSSMLGKESGEHLAYIAIVFVVFVLFPDQIFLKIFFILISILSFLLLEISNYSLFNLPILASDSHYYILNFIATITILMFIFYYIRKIANKELIDILQNSKAQLEAIFDNSFDGILLLNIDDFYLKDCNLRAKQLFRAPNKEHFIRNNPDHLLKQFSGKDEIVTIKSELIKSNKWSSEYELETVEGDSFWGDVAITIIEMEEYKRLLVRITDISEKKTAEAKIAQTLNELKNRNFELDSLVYSTSHDLRAPIASILGLVNIAKIEEDIENLRNYFNLIEKSSLKLDKVILNIVEYSKAINAPIKIEKVSIEDLIYQSYDDLQFLNNADRLRILIVKEQSEDLYTDRLRIETVLKNLISNSIKFLRTECHDNFMKFEIKIDKTNFEMAVVDNGEGIEEKYQPDIFSMFHKGTHKLSGSGLGLYISKLNIEKLNGTIQLESSYGKGTKFIIQFPNLINEKLNGFIDLPVS